jgi:hypothetical protein
MQVKTGKRSFRDWQLLADVSLAGSMTSGQVSAGRGHPKLTGAGIALYGAARKNGVEPRWLWK